MKNAVIEPGSLSGWTIIPYPRDEVLDLAFPGISCLANLHFVPTGGVGLSRRDKRTRPGVSTPGIDKYMIRPEESLRIILRYQI